MAGFNSFEMLLRKYLAITNPFNILEWGTGTSTSIMRDECPFAKIYTLEHDVAWFQRYSKQFESDKRTFVIHAPVSLYADLPLQWHKPKVYELVFVDGYCDLRVSCLRTAHKLVSNEGVVILHDSERTKYAEGVKLFRKIEEQDGTLVMKK